MVQHHKQVFVEVHLALMDAGVPIKRPVAGISTGLSNRSKNDDKIILMLTDIQGIEDFFGDMDFKGRKKNGITAIQ